MVNLKSFDFFRKIQSDVHAGSATGGLFTIFAFVIGTVLLLHSFNEHYRDRYVTQLIIKTDESQKLPLRLDLLMTKCPCDTTQKYSTNCPTVLAIKFHDEVQYEESGLEFQLNRTRVAKDGIETPYIKIEDREKEKENLLKAIDNEEGCRIWGVLNIPKTPGFIKIDQSGNMFIMKEIPTHVHKLRASYRLEKLVIGKDETELDLPIYHVSEYYSYFTSSICYCFKDRLANMQWTWRATTTASSSCRISAMTSRKTTSSATSKSSPQGSLTTRPTRPASSSIDTRSVLAEPPSSPSCPASPSCLRQSPSTSCTARWRPQDTSQSSEYNLAPNIIFAIIGGAFATIGIVNSISQSIADLIKKFK